MGAWGTAIGVGDKGQLGCRTPTPKKIQQKYFYGKDNDNSGIFGQILCKIRAFSLIYSSRATFLT